MGLLPGGALSTLVAADSCLIWEVPNFWTLEEAATIPVIYITVLYCFSVVIIKIFNRRQKILSCL